MAIETFQRQEIKFLLNEIQYQALTEQLEQYMNPDPYCVGGKDYGIYNIYYDTPDDFSGFRFQSESEDEGPRHY